MYITSCDHVLAGMRCMKERLLAEENVEKNVMATIIAFLSNGMASQPRIRLMAPITVKLLHLARMRSPLSQAHDTRRTYMLKVTFTNSSYNCTSK